MTILLVIFLWTISTFFYWLVYLTDEHSNADNKEDDEDDEDTNDGEKESLLPFIWRKIFKISKYLKKEVLEL